MPNEYINNKDFESLIVKYLEDPEDDQIKEEITLCFYILSNAILQSFNFKLIDKEDALQEGVLVCLQKMERFNPERGKAFNWFTTIILNHYRQLYRTSKNDLNLKKRYMESKIIDQTTSVFEGSSSELDQNVSDRIRRNFDQH
jgi:DNA-directed RNA polymerase specialized sigma24 family protein